MQFPREWLGPADELVPFGVPTDSPRGPAPDVPRAPAPDVPRAPATDLPRAPADAADDIAPASAQSFWTEDAASLHAALQGAPPASDRDQHKDHDESPPEPGQARLTPRRPTWLTPRRPTPLSTRRATRLTLRRPNLRRRAVPVLALGLSSIAALAIIGTLLGPAHTAAPISAPARAAGVGVPAVELGRNAADWRFLARVKEGIGARQGIGASGQRSGKASTRSAHPARPAHSHRHAARRAAVTPHPAAVVSYRAPTTTASGATGVTASQPSAASTATPSNQPSSRSDSRATSTSSGSTNQTSHSSPASLLGPGHCACG